MQMTQNDFGLVMSAALDMGKILLVAGAEIYRTEDTIKRIVSAYGGAGAQINAVPSHIIANAVFEGREYTLMRRIKYTDTDVEILDRLNALSRRICAETPAPKALAGMIKQATDVKKYTAVQMSFIYAFVSAAFTLFFAGGPADAAVSAFTGGTLYWLMQLIKRTGGNRVFVDLLGSAYSAFMAVTLTRIGIGYDADKVIIGVVMVLIPGIEMLNGSRDFIAGDIQAGLMHLAEALFLAIIIAVGAAGMFALMGTKAV